MPPDKRDEIAHQELAGGEVVLLHLETGAYHELNPIGALIWELLDGNRTVPQLVEEVRDRVDEPPDDLDAVVEEFLDELRQRDLIA